MKIVVTSFFALISLTFVGCTSPKTDKKENACCPGYESVAQPNKCVKLKTKCMTENTMKEQVKVAQPMVKDENILGDNSPLRIGVVGQGVAPVNTSSPAQAYALAKRAAIADAYRLIAEKVKGVRIEGDDLIKNMMVKRSTVRTAVKAMVRNADVVETTYKDGLCEVEMEIVLSYTDFAQ
jgi:hypothetical protein